jgi:thioredoxin reductase/CRP-like cAMP-binding protein/Fe-S-cluster-containing hydrogenase component 2
MSESYEVVIVGSGPAGISAAGRAAEAGVSHLLLERASRFADTIHKYQKGKYVMATPARLPLRSALAFAAGSREDILENWRAGLEAKGVNIRFNCEVASISGSRGAFEITLADGSAIVAQSVVMAIGLQGNLNKLTVPGAELPLVQYQLDDPGEYEDESIVVIGAGDAAIENAIALARQNRVVIVNRRGEFSRAKTGNLNQIRQAIDSGTLKCEYNSEPVRIEAGRIVLKASKGEATIACDRIIARLGANPPRKFVESCGVKFRSSDTKSFPEVSNTYESNVPGLYIVGALAGYPLIKHCMNQGYEVIEYIRGESIVPADEPLLEEKFAIIPDRPGVNEMLDRIEASVPLFAGLTRLQLREFLLGGEVLVKAPGEPVFLRNDHGDTLFAILDGSVAVEVDADDPSRLVWLGKGEFFGEIGLISGRRRSATICAATECTLIEVPRFAAVKLINTIPAAKQLMDETVLSRQFRAYLQEDLSIEDLRDLASSSEIVSFDFGTRLIEEGAVDNDSVYVIRTGSVKVSRKVGGRDIVLNYVPAGNMVGEMALLRDAPRSATVTAAIKGEAIKLDGGAVRRVLEHMPTLKAKLDERVRGYLRSDLRREKEVSHSNTFEFFLDQGGGEATDILLIDEALCVRCDNCEKACAETHGGISRLDREAGPTFGSLHIPTSCRHCEHPHCMTDCPPDAIHRAPGGEVWIDDSCIGCGNCQVNCPYGVIQMAALPPPKPGLLQWLLLGRGPGPGEDKSPHKSHEGKSKPPKLAVKCDMCLDIKGGPACVRACPTGAAVRRSPEETMILGRRAQ